VAGRKRPSADVYGEQLWSFYKTGEPRYEIVERDDGMIRANDFSAATYFSDYADWDPLERKAIRLAYGRVLDIGCGAGRHSLYLQDRGFEVTAIDASPLSVRVARLRGLRRAKVMSIDEIGAFPPASFETVLLLGYNFGLMGSPRRAHRLLRLLHRITSEDAAIIAMTVDQRCTSDPADRAYQARQKRRGKWPGQVRFRLRYRNLMSPWRDDLSVSRSELRTLLEGSGWAVRRFLDGRGGTYVMVLGK
jgi:SAM-dependent methyltransferase